MEAEIRTSHHAHVADEILNFAEEFTSLEASGISFVELNEQPYTGYEPQEVAIYKRLIEEGGLEGLRGIDAVMTASRLETQ